MKKHLFLSLVLIMSSHLLANDTIVLKNSTRIDAKILEVSRKGITYQLPDTSLTDYVFKQKTKDIAVVLFENGEIKTAENLLPAKKRSECVLFGVSVGAGMGIISSKHDGNRMHLYKSDYDYELHFEHRKYLSIQLQGMYSMHLGIDAAWKINEKNALGFYVKTAGLVERHVLDTLGRVYPEPSFKTNYLLGTRISAGLLGVVGNIPNGGAFIYGIGSGYGNISQMFWMAPLELRLGGVLKNGFYFTSDIAVNIRGWRMMYDVYYNGYTPAQGEWEDIHATWKGSIVDISLHFGYNFQCSK